MLGLVRTVAPAEEPLSLEEAKAHLRVRDSRQDDTILEMIRAAREEVEEQYGRALITQTWQRTLSGFPASGRLWLPRAPLQSVSQVQYRDLAGALQVWSSAEYLVHAAFEPGYLEPAPDFYWPSTQCRADAVVVTYVAGYGDDAAAVPESIRRALKLKVEDAYGPERGDVIVGTISSRLGAVDRLLAPYQVRLTG